MKQYLKNTWEGIWTVLVGMKVTFKHLFTPAVTIQYPDEHRPIPDRARNRLYVNIDDCIGCMQCQRACPVQCINIETVKAVPGDEPGVTSQGSKKALWVTKFEIDFAKCMYCQLCVFPCPTECIYMTEVFEFSEDKREDLLYNFSNLNLTEILDKKKKYEEFMAKKAAEKAAAAKAKAEASAKAKAEAEAKAKAEAAKKDAPAEEKKEEKEEKNDNQSSSEQKQ